MTFCALYHAWGRKCWVKEKSGAAHLGCDPNSDPYKVRTLAELLKTLEPHFKHLQNRDNGVSCIGLG